MIEFSHVYKTYRGSAGRECHALRDVTLKIEKGEFVYLTGPSGAGKTTLFRILSAFDRPSSGRVQVLQQDIGRLTSKTLPSFRRHIGVVFQDFKLLRDRTVYENIALPLKILGESDGLIRRRVQDCLDQVGLSNRGEDLPELLSGGEQQRVAIARAVIHRPGLLIADEPTGNLDREMALSIMKLFERANAQGTTLFIATHDQSLIQNTTKRIIEIKSGQIVQKETGAVWAQG